MTGHEDGAVAVMTALLMVVLLGMSAIVVDIGMLYAERAQLQSGADAAALAIAQDCATAQCGDYVATARTLANANANDSRSAAAPVIAGNTVTVQTSTVTRDGGTAVRHWFAPILGIDSTRVVASAKASWGSPSKATVFPFTAPTCLFNQTPTNTEIWITSASACIGAAGTRLPGAFGWLDEDGKKNCRASVDIDQTILGGAPGKSGPQNCNIDGTTILLPVYDQKSGQGNNVTYVIHGFAAFRVTAHSWPSHQLNQPPDCNNCTGVKGRFITLVSLQDLQSFGVEELGGPALNAFFVSLSQ
ncbi:pilus assembly protein TadG-related protein [Arthrobacter sp. OAP107]|uniref:TadE/TadG family type IV pilus assembly protein n=1 Tax=Arthrobacter sp. OAP107 TaxID=3156445 RepID=UPI0033908DC8